MSLEKAVFDEIARIADALNFFFSPFLHYDALFINTKWKQHKALITYKLLELYHRVPVSDY